VNIYGGQYNHGADRVCHGVVQYIHFGTKGKDSLDVRRFQPMATGSISNRYLWSRMTVTDLELYAGNGTWNSCDSNKKNRTTAQEKHHTTNDRRERNGDGTRDDPAAHESQTNNTMH